MSVFNFFEHCYKATKEEYFKVISSPTKSRKYTKDYKKIMNDLEKAIMYNEISKQEGEQLKKKFKELDYIAYKEKMKKAGM